MNEVKILIIDDYKDTLETIKDAIEISFDCVKVETVIDGVDGYGLCCIKKYDIIICDFKMPILNGDQTCKYIQKSEDSLNRNTPIIVMSEFISDIKEEHDTSFATSLITKPVEINDLVTLIEGSLGSKLCA